MKRMIQPKTRTFLLVLGALVLLALLLAVGSAAGGVKLLGGDAVSTAEKRAAYLAGYGWEVDAASEQVQQILIPERFSAVYETYNQLQKQQGWDLSKFAGRSCTLYSYTVTNYPDPEQTVIADLYVFKNKVIAGDVHSTNLNGFMIGLK